MLFRGAVQPAQLLVTMVFPNFRDLLVPAIAQDLFAGVIKATESRLAVNEDRERLP